MTNGGNSGGSGYRDTDPRDKRYLQLVVGRANGQSDAATAKKLRYDTPRQLYRQIDHDGHPICVVCGKMYPPNNCCELFQRRERHPKRWGKATKLPPAEEAIGLFKHALDRLGQEVENLREREEFLQSERYVGTQKKGDWWMALGAWHHPPEPLTTLIAVYALWAGYANSPLMWWLLDKLHPSESFELREPMRRGECKAKRPDPREVDMAKLNNKMRALRRAAVQVAQIVRGKDVKKGPPTGELSPRHHAVLRLVQYRSDQELADHQIAQELNSRYRFGIVEEPFTSEEVREILDLNADLP